MNIVVMIDGSRSYFAVRGDNQSKWFDIRYPYKAIYGLPNSLKCPHSIYKRFDECEKTSHKDWDITIDEYVSCPNKYIMDDLIIYLTHSCHQFYETKKFCCFIWDAMNCEIDVAKQCNHDYSIELELNTKQTYQTICNHIGYGHGSWKCWWTENRIITVSSVVGAALVILTIFCIAYGLYKYNNRSKNKVE